MRNYKRYQLSKLFTWDNVLYGLMLCLLGGFVLQRIIGEIDNFQMFQLIISLLMLYSTILMVKSTSKSAKASELQAKAAVEMLKASVAPRLIFNIRPANDYWNGPFGQKPRDWKPGVGIYIENIGAGPALKIKMTYRVIGEIEEHTFKAEFKRMKVGMLYTLPSKHYPQLEIKPTHSQIIIDSLEYEDIRTPANHYQLPEKEVLNLNEGLFKEPDKQ